MELAERLANISLLIMDVDGVLTDGRVILDDDGIELKAFDVTDGHGLKMLHREGLKLAIVTGRSSEVVKHRAKELGIDFVRQGAKDKLEVVRTIISKMSVKPENIAFMGDDLVDLPVMLQVGLGVTVPDAPEYIRSRAHMVTTRRGGRGAVRELCDAILEAKGLWEKATDRYFKPEPF